MIIRPLLRLRRWHAYQGEEGLMALWTLSFMMTIGVAMIGVLWGLGNVSGAYTTLYQSTQAAAYAAVNEVQITSTGGPYAEGGAQLPFLCGDGFDYGAANPVCTSGRTALAATTLLSENLKTQAGFGRYGLTYPGTVQLLDANGNAAAGIIVYYIPWSAGAAQAADPTCSGSVNSPETSSVRTCWQSPAIDGVRDSNYVSGVVVSAQSTVPFIPGCNGWICPRVTIHAVVSAREGQVLPQKGY